MTTTEQLRERVEARCHDLLTQLQELKGDARQEAEDARRAIRARLAEVEQDITVGWERMTETVKLRLTQWLDR